ncbi:MAG: peptidylprolyl isomerase [Candidatus Acidiferrales bacterium]
MDITRWNVVKTRIALVVIGAALLPALSFPARSFGSGKPGTARNKADASRTAVQHVLTPSQRERVLRYPQDAFWKRPAPSVYRVKCETTAGAFVLEVTRSQAPLGADRFYHLVQAGFYNDSRFYRVIAGRFVQFGIAGDPKIAQVWQHASFPDDPVRASNVPRTFAFAMTGPNTRTTQIYINTGDQSRLDKMGFAPFGKVVEGMDVVDRLYSGYAEHSGGGMRGGRQGKLFEQGNAYLDREFPRLDKMIRAEITSHP